MLIKVLGRDYIVWDKAVSMQFKKPGRGTLYGRFHLPDDEIASIKAQAASGEPFDRIYEVNLIDKENVVHFTAEKTLYIRLK